MDATAIIDEMIGSLPWHEQVAAKRLRALIRECLPHAKEKTYDDFNLPFYSHNRIMCFIWPPSLSFEQDKRGDQKGKGVALGFQYGKLFSNDDGILQSEGRRQVFAVYFKTIADIDEARVKSLLFEADVIDRSFRKK